jgi:hypothetical protein
MRHARRAPARVPIAPRHPGGVALVLAGLVAGETVVVAPAMFAATRTWPIALSLGRG